MPPECKICGKHYWTGHPCDCQSSMVAKAKEQPVSGVGAGCEQMRTIKSQENNDLTMPAGSNPRTSCAPMGEASDINGLSCANAQKTDTCAPTKDQPDELPHNAQWLAYVEEMAKRDDWHKKLVGSDIRMLCGLIRRYQASPKREPAQPGDYFCADQATLEKALRTFDIAMKASGGDQSFSMFQALSEVRQPERESRTPQRMTEAEAVEIIWKSYKSYPKGIYRALTEHADIIRKEKP